MVNIIEPPRTLPNLGVNSSQENTEKFNIMAAKAFLQCRPNSHPFPERTLVLDQPVKIGRSVAKAKPAASNAIFDCKVLSRNHAILWYENGKFYLKDTKSSNGTFVNNQRLSKGSEESMPREVFSSDIVQFGVDVVEDFKKVSHGCVIATLKLYLPDGQEAKASSVTAESGSVCSITLQEFYALRSCLEEASQREQQINAKLATLLLAVNSAHEVAFQGWTTMVDEDILLQRLELLQGQLATFSKSYPEGDAKADVRQLQEEKGQIEINAKQSVAKILKEKLDIEIQCADLERKATSMNIELESLREMLVSYKTEIDELLKRHDKQAFKMQDLSDQLKTAEEELNVERKEKVESSHYEMELGVKVEKLKAENDFIKEQCNVIKSKYENLKNANRLSEIEVDGPITDANRIFETLRHTLRNLRDKLRAAQDDTPDIQEAISRLNRGLQQTTANDAKYKTEKNNLEEELIELKGKLKADASITEHFQSVEAASYKKLSVFMDGVLAGNTISKSMINDIENNQTNDCALLKDVEICSEAEDKNEAHIQLCIYMATSLREEMRNAADAAGQSKNNKIQTEEKLDQAQKKYLEVTEALTAADNRSMCVRQKIATKEGVMQNNDLYHLNELLDHMTQLESATDHIQVQFFCLANSLAKEREAEKLRNKSTSVNNKLEAAEKLSVTVTQEDETVKTELTSSELHTVQTSVTTEAVEEKAVEYSLIGEEVIDGLPICNTEELSASQQDIKDSVYDRQESNIEALSGEEYVLEDSSHKDVVETSELIETPADSLQDQLTVLKQENHRLKSQLSIQNEEFSDLAMRNQIGVPTWHLAVLIVLLYYSWSLYCYLY